MENGWWQEETFIFQQILLWKTKSLLKNFIKLGEIGFEHELYIPYVSESWCVKVTLKYYIDTLLFPSY